MHALINNPKLYLTLLILAIFAVSSLMLIEVKPTPQTWPKDKVQHAFIFAVLTYLGLKAFPKQVLKITMAIAIYGGLIEILQTQFTQTRTGSVLDLMADIAGIAFGFGLLALHRQVFKKMSHERI